MQPNNNLLVVESRHNGPPGSGNGGWTSGLIAAQLFPAHHPPIPQPQLDAPIPEVTLLKPPPLETELSVIHTGGGLRVTDPSGVLIATARPRGAPIEAVPGVSREEAIEATDRYPGHGQHHFPTCFVCGPQRPDGLKIFPGRLADGRTAATFTTPLDVAPVTIWAALDCPGGWTVIEGDRPWVLGRLAVAIDDLPKPGSECIVAGQAVHRDGRKAVVRTTLWDSLGVIMARGEATWIQLPAPVA